MNAEHLFPGAFHGRLRKRKMDSHLVAVEVSVKCGTDQRMNLNCGAVNQYRFKSLDTEAVQRRCAVEQNRPFFDNFFEDIVDLGFGSFDLPPCALDIMCQPLLNQAAHDKGFE